MPRKTNEQAASSDSSLKWSLICFGVQIDKGKNSNPTVFHGYEGAVELSRWFEKTEMVFGISECAEARKVKFVAATLQGRALTWWNSQVAMMGLEAANQIGWTEMKRIMTDEFCPVEEVQRMEHELWNLKVKEFDITAYTKRFHELVHLCPEMVPSERKKIEAYIRV
ncbi:putative zinc finger, CCHC-type, retrotransposon gag domain protein [Tanacetum coccineum]